MPDAPHWQVDLNARARRQLRKLDKPTARRILTALTALERDPRPAPPTGLPLTGHPGLRRLRVGDYRVVYEVHDDTLVVLVVTIGHRREVYDRL